jgi:hypothetical protein
MLPLKNEKIAEYGSLGLSSDAGFIDTMGLI